MKVVVITKATRQADRRFWDIQGDVYEVEKPEDFECCSICAINGKKPHEKIRLVMSYKQVKEIQSYVTE